MIVVAFVRSPDDLIGAMSDCQGTFELDTVG